MKKKANKTSGKKVYKKKQSFVGLVKEADKATNFSKSLWALSKLAAVFICGLYFLYFSKEIGAPLVEYFNK